MSSTPADGTVGLTRLLQNASMLQIATAVITILVVRQLARAVYRVTFHPLSKYPGPKFAAASRIPQLIAQFTGAQHHRIGAAHRKYGHIVRVAPDELSFIGPDAWRDIHGHGSKGTPGVKPTKYWRRYGKNVNNVDNLIQARDEPHARMRRIFNPAFSDRALKQQEPLFMKYVNLLVEKCKEGVKENSDRAFDMVRMYNYTTFDVMGDLTFGEPLHMLETAEYSPWVALIFGSIKMGTRISIIHHYPWLHRLFQQVVPASMTKKRYEHFQFSVDRVTKRLEKGRDSEGVDLWDLVLSQPEGKGLSRGEMDSNSSLFMIAGTETTATLVSGLTYLLLKNPEKMEKLNEEIRSTFTTSEDMHIENIAGLPYLNACIREGLRMYPPVPLGLPRITPPEGSTICGTFVPPGTTVTVPQLAMYTDEKNFKDPLSFIPERWLGDEQYDGDSKASLQPFSVGSRDCLGKNMAYHEMRLIMAKMLYHFDYQLCPESDNWSDQETYFLWAKVPLMCKLTPVN